MKENKIKNVLDFTVLIVLVVQAIILVWTVFTTDIVFVWKHIVGLAILPINFLVFRWHHKAGVLFLGVSLLLGLSSLLSYSPAVATTTITVGGDNPIPIFYGQLIFLLWLLIHFIISARHYVGILSKKYWIELIASLPVQIFK